MEMDMTIVTLTLTTVVSLLALLVGGMIGWMARQHSYETTPQVVYTCLLYTSPSPRDRTRSRMPSSA